MKRMPAKSTEDMSMAFVDSLLMPAADTAGLLSNKNICPNSFDELDALVSGMLEVQSQHSSSTMCSISGGGLRAAFPPCSQASTRPTTAGPSDPARQQQQPSSRARLTANTASCINRKSSISDARSSSTSHSPRENIFRHHVGDALRSSQTGSSSRSSARSSNKVITPDHRSSDVSDVLDMSSPEWQAQFFKTKLCPLYNPAANNRQGVSLCPNQDTCRFAHSKAELRPLPDLRQTKLCPSYTKKVRCTTPHCTFAHTPEELRTSSTVFYKVSLCNFYKNRKCWNGPNCRFAHGAHELRNPLPPPFKKTVQPSNHSDAPTTDQTTPSFERPQAPTHREEDYRRLHDELDAAFKEDALNGGLGELDGAFNQQESFNDDEGRYQARLRELLSPLDTGTEELIEADPWEASEKYMMKNYDRLLPKISCNAVRSVSKAGLGIGKTASRQSHNSSSFNHYSMTPASYEGIISQSSSSSLIWPPAPSDLFERDEQQEQRMLGTENDDDDTTQSNISLDGLVSLLREAFVEAQTSSNNQFNHRVKGAKSPRRRRDHRPSEDDGDHHCHHGH